MGRCFFSTLALVVLASVQLGVSVYVLKASPPAQPMRVTDTVQVNQCIEAITTNCANSNERYLIAWNKRALGSVAIAKRF